MKIRAILLIMTVTLTACATSSVKQATEREDVEAKKFITYPGKATVYVYRDNTQGPGEIEMPSKLSLPLWVDGKSMGIVGIHTYQRLILEPGEHVFASEGKNRDETVINTKAGEVTFVQIEDNLDILMRSEVSVFKPDQKLARELMKDFFLVKYIGEE